MSYHSFVNEDGEEYGSFEVFEDRDDDNEIGFYWWPCFPGCLPDSEANGPFATEQEAIDNAQEMA